jgi:hypothetical protein
MTIEEETREVSAGNALYIPSNKLHGIRNTGNEVLEYLTVNSPALDREYGNTLGPRSRIRDSVLSHGEAGYITVTGGFKKRGHENGMNPITSLSGQSLLCQVLLFHKRQGQLPGVGFAEAAAAGGVAAGPGQAGVQIDEVLVAFTPTYFLALRQLRQNFLLSPH